MDPQEGKGWTYKKMAKYIFTALQIYACHF